MDELITEEKIKHLGFKEQQSKSCPNKKWFKKGMIGISKLDEEIYGISFLISLTFDLGENEEITHLHKKHIKYICQLKKLDSALNS